MADEDPIDRMRAQWASERPDLDSAGFALVGRILLLGKLLERRVSEALEPLGLALWAFDVLATLRRQGPPYRLAPTALSRATLLTPGAITHRLDRLEEAGLVRRLSDPQDGRGVLVELTRRGHREVDRAIEVRLAEAEEAVGTLSARERATLEGLLRRLVLALAEPAP